MFHSIEFFTTQILFQLYSVTGNLGIAIIALTLLIRLLLFPLSVKTLKSQKKLQEIKPELDALKKKYGKDAAKFQQEQVALYKRYNINPLAGCLPYVVQIGLLILLYRVLLSFLAQTEMFGQPISPSFLWLDLRQADPFHILPILAGLTQFVLSLMIAPGAEHRDIVANDSVKKKEKEQNKKEEDVSEMAQTMQQQMLFIMPVMTGFIAWKFQSGLALYWVTTTLFSIAQQYYVSGWGGMFSYGRELQLRLHQLLSKRQS